MAGTNAEALSKIDPEFEALLKAVPAAPDISSIPLPALRAGMAQRKSAMLEAMSKSLPTEGMTVKEATIPARDGYAIPIRTYTPDNPRAGGAPLVVFYHGGGFCLGDLDGEELNCRLFASKLGCVVVNVDYRLAPEWKFPYAILDAWDGLKWAAANATSIGATPTAGFIIGGTSAGGTIAGVLSQKARDETLSPRLTGTCLLIPGMVNHGHLPEKYKEELVSLTQNANAPILSWTLIEKFLEAYAPDKDTPLHGPLNNGRFENLPPTFLQVCGLDPLRDEAIVYERVVREEFGVKTKMEVYPGVAHGYWSMFPEWEKSKKFVADTVAGVEWLLEVGRRK